MILKHNSFERLRRRACSFAKLLSTLATIAGSTVCLPAHADDDSIRQAAVSEIVAALETFGAQNDTFVVNGAGHSGRGTGWFHYEGGAYTKSIANELIDIGLLEAPAPRDPLHISSARTFHDFMVYRCDDRIAVFSKADSIAPATEDADWWAAHGCTTNPIDRQNLPYYEVSAPLLTVDNDTDREQAVSEIITALENYADNTNSYRVAGGHNQKGGGWFLYDGGGTYQTSIASALITAGVLSDPAPRDPLHESTNSRNHDFMVYHCEDRVAVFSGADSIEPTTADATWWSDNNCTTSPITRYNRSYFQLSAPLPPTPLPPVTEPSLDQYTLVFEDEFSGSSLDPSKWDTALLWGPYDFINNEQQMYIDTHGMHSGYSYNPFEVSGGTLKITATATDSSVQAPNQPPENDPSWQAYSYSEFNYNPDYNRNDIEYLSGIISSYDSFKITHGYVEARIKLPAGRGLWPAFWMLPTHYVEDVPEIDIMEFLGQDTDRLYHTYHYFDTKNNWQHHRTPEHIEYNSDWTADFHTFGMSWSPRDIRWYVDGVETFRTTQNQLDIAGQSMYLLANLAVGGNWPGPPDASTPFPAVLEIDYIRAYKKNQTESLDLSSNYRLMFRDEFNGSSLDASKWNTHFLWGPYLPINNEEQYYVDALGSDNGTTASPFSVDNGRLTITARASDDPSGFDIPLEAPAADDPIWNDYPSFVRNSNYTQAGYSSGLITSYDAFKFSYGYAEIRARVPEGDGLWPAFWLLNGYYVNQQPEIDIMEIIGENPNVVSHSYHRLNDDGITVSDSYTTTYNGGYDDGFHRYGVRWRPGRIDWYVDRQLQHSYISDDVGYQLMYVIANLAVGGDFNTQSVDNSKIPARYEIDYIRVYQEREPQ